MTRVAMIAGYEPSFARAWAAAAARIADVVLVHLVDRPTGRVGTVADAGEVDGIPEIEVVVERRRPTVAWGPVLDRVNARRLERALREVEAHRGRVDLIHGHFYSSVTEAVRTRWPVVLTEHSNVFLRVRRPGGNTASDRRSLAVARRTYARLAGAIAISAHQRDHLVEALPGVEPVIIHNPVAGPPDGWSATGAHDRSRRLLSIGRLTRTKRPDVLVRALAELPPDLVDGLDLVGRGDLERDLLTLAAELGLSERVRCLGRIDEDLKWALLGSARLLVSASEVEGFCLPVVEALTAATPVCATPVGIAPELASLGAVQVADGLGHESFARALRSALESPRVEVGPAERAWLADHVAPDAVAARLAELYEAVR